jgi:hypothetical protein
MVVYPHPQWSSTLMAVVQILFWQLLFDRFSLVRYSARRGRARLPAPEMTISRTQTQSVRQRDARVGTPQPQEQQLRDARRRLMQSTRPSRRRVPEATPHTTRTTDRSCHVTTRMHMGRVTLPCPPPRNSPVPGLLRRDGPPQMPPNRSVPPWGVAPGGRWSGPCRRGILPGATLGGCRSVRGPVLALSAYPRLAARGASDVVARGGRRPCRRLAGSGHVPVFADSGSAGAVVLGCPHVVAGCANRAPGVLAHLALSAVDECPAAPDAGDRGVPRADGPATRRSP